MVDPSEDEPIRPSFKGPAVTRFFWGFGATFLVSLLWPLSLLIWLPEYASLWIQNNPTFTLIHLTFFSGAIGLFASVLDLDQLRRLPGPLLASVLALLVGFVVIVSGLAYNDLVYRELSIYQQSPHATEVQEGLRKMWKEKGQDTDEYKKLLEEYKGLVKPPDSFGSVLQRCTPVAFVTLLMNWGFGVFWATYMWYIFVLGVLWALGYAKLNRLKDPRLVVTLAMITTWFPARLYGDWWQHCFVPGNAGMANPILAANLIIVVLILLLLVFYRVIHVLRFRVQAFTYFVFGLTLLVCLLMALGWTEPIFNLFEEGTRHGIFPFVAVTAVVLLIAVIVALSVLPIRGRSSDGGPGTSID